MHNRRPTLGHTYNATIQSKTSTRYRQGYHYQPIASTSSQQSPTFVLETRQYPPSRSAIGQYHSQKDHDAIVDCPVSAPDDDEDGAVGGAAMMTVPPLPIPGPPTGSASAGVQQPQSHQQQKRKSTTKSPSADVAW